MKTTELESPEALAAFLADPQRDWRKVVVHDLDLAPFDYRLAAEPLCATTVFLGCHLGPRLAVHAATTGALLLTPRPHLPFNPFRRTCYHWQDLFDHFSPDDPESYRLTTDWLAYGVAMNPATRRRRDDLTLADELVFRLHDFCQEDALHDFLKPVPGDPSTWRRVVAIMGGHDLERQEKRSEAPSEDAPYTQVALLAARLTREGFLIATGGGPGAMEAGNLGAFFAHCPEAELRAAIRALAVVPKIKPLEPGSSRWNSGQWLAPAVEIVRAFPGTPGESIGIPTWFYGHEPPNVFATCIAKYFENSLREEGLLAIASHGVVFAPGNAGTVQEIFQDACQNYYGTYGRIAPMILLDAAYWNRPADGPAGPKHKPVWPLLQQLARERTAERFPDAITLTDSIDEVVARILAHAATPA